jgi:DNA repair exonuclease SbcCD ATPase subunit
MTLKKEETLDIEAECEICGTNPPDGHDGDAHEIHALRTDADAATAEIEDLRASLAQALKERDEARNKALNEAAEYLMTVGVFPQVVSAMRRALMSKPIEAKGEEPKRPRAEVAKELRELMDTLRATLSEKEQLWNGCPKCRRVPCACDAPRADAMKEKP